MSAVDPLRWVSGFAWLVLLGLLLPPLWRLLLRRARYLDGLWAVMLIGVVNRLMFVSRATPLAISYLAAILLAALLCIVIWSYQRADR